MFRSSPWRKFGMRPTAARPAFTNRLPALYYPSVSVVPPPSFFELPEDVSVFRVDCYCDMQSPPPFEKEVLTKLAAADLCMPQILGRSNDA